MEVRILDVRDRDKVCELYELLQSGFQVEISLEKFEDRLMAIKPDIYFIESFFDKKMRIVSAAFADVKASYTRFGYILEINNVVTHPAFHRMGCGKTIIDRIIEDSGNYYYKITLNCTDSNVGFYEKCGFIKYGSEMRYVK